jgi:hypothetical protein
MLNQNRTTRAKLKALLRLGCCCYSGPMPCQFWTREFLGLATTGSTISYHWTSANFNLRVCSSPVAGDVEQSVTDPLLGCPRCLRRGGEGFPSLSEGPFGHAGAEFSTRDVTIVRVSPWPRSELRPKAGTSGNASVFSAARSWMSPFFVTVARAQNY